MTTESSFEWLESAQGRGIIPGLERMEHLLNALGRPEQSLRSLHVAGTNGKGSVCAVAESVLRASGVRTGLYTSPHLVRFSERIRVDGTELPDDLIREGIGRLRAATEGWREREMPTYFELVTALAFDLFAQEGVEIVVLETGLGGRLDATNTAPKLACAITPIGLDHTEWLGGTLPEIAREKAGILRPGIPVVCAPQEPEASAVLREASARLGAPFHQVTEPLESSLPLALKGPHQRWNAALALALIGVAGIPLPREAIARGLASVHWPGRFQHRVWQGREIFLDGAHNLHAACQLAATWRSEMPGRRCRLLFGALADKNPEALLAELAPLADEIILVPVASARTARPEELARSLGSYSGVVHTAPSLRNALVDDVNAPGAPLASGEPPILLSGSLFLVGEALAIMEGGDVLPRSQ